MDWNNDGKKDLLTGENSGNIRIYLNTGTDEDPTFSGYNYVQVGGSNYDCGNYSVPWVVDWNSDGKKDLLCGENGGKVALLLNTGTDANPVFGGSVYLKDGLGNLDAGDRVSPAAADWNRDGKKDLLVGEMYGRILYYENVGTDEIPVFDGSEYLKAGGEIIDVYYYARICVADWDNDNVLDLLSGNRNYDFSPSGGVFYFQAEGPLHLNQNFISESTGGSLRFDLQAGVENANRNYIILGSISGTDPGTPLPGGLAVLPINWDVFTDFMVPLLNSSLFQNFLGALNANGQSIATLSTGPIPGVSGIVMSYAYALNDPWDYASNGANIEFVP